MRWVLSLVLFLALPATVRGEPTSFAWFDVETGLAAADSTGKLVMVEVYTRWCGWCKKLDRQVLSKKEIQDYLAEKFISIKLDAEDARSSVVFAGRRFSYAELARAFGVESYPMTLFLDSRGQLLYRLSGYYPPEDYLKVLQYFGERRFLKNSRDEG